MLKKAMLLLTFLLILTTCQAVRSPASTSFKIEFGEDGFLISAQRLIASASITVTAVNRAASDHQFMILSEPLSKGIESLVPGQVIFQMLVPVNQTVTGSFQAPPAPGEYWLICSEPGHLEKGESGKIVVVHPDYAR